MRMRMVEVWLSLMTVERSEINECLSVLSIEKLS
jgi:hypothetical protein